MPLVGLGTYESTDSQVLSEVIRAALGNLWLYISIFIFLQDAGYRHIDTAFYYKNHKIIGDALQEIFSEGKYHREDLFITTKFWPTKETNALEIL
jgi:diketogulonate reductase-like aldo/keto reductase